MKRYTELTEQELVELTEDQIQTLIDRECAEDGVPLLPDRPTPPTSRDVIDDASVFRVTSSGSSAVAYCTSAGAAQRLLEVLNRMRNDGEIVEVEYLSGPSFRRRVKALSGPFTATPEMVLSETTADTLGAEIEARERALKAFEKAEREYQAAAQARREAEDRVRSAVEAAAQRHRAREMRRREFARYVELAGGDETIAARFLVAARPDAFELLPELRDLAPPDHSLHGSQ